MDLLIAGCLAFFITHLGISGTPLRAALLRLLGQPIYTGVYVLISIGTFAVMLYGYGQASHSDFLWAPSVEAYWVTKALLLIAFLLLAMGAMVKNPTQVMMDKAVEDELAGLLKITRHPIQWAILIFSIGHIIANGDVASIWLFGTLALVSALGMLSMDARRRKEQSPHWQAFMAGTSTLPFLALAQGKATLSLREFNWAALVVGLCLYVAVYWLHDMVSGGVSLF